MKALSRTESSIYVVKIIWIDNGKYITAINKKFIHFSLFELNTDDF